MVLTFLQERGFTDSAAKLRDEAQALPELTERLRRSVRSAVGSGLLFHSAQAICSLDRCFRKLREWVEGSLEQYRRELAATLYPLFVRSYLELVHRGLPDEAGAFMEAHRADFGPSSPELVALAAVRTPAQVEESELAREYWRSAFELRLSAYSFELLVAFVQAEQLLPVLQLLNGEHFRIVITRRAPPLESGRGREGGEPALPHTAAEIFGRVDEVNAQEVTLGLLEELHAEHLAASAKHAGAADAAAQAEPASAGAPAAAQQRKRGGGSAKRARDGQASAQALAKSRIPLPVLSRALEEKLVVDALHCAPLSASRLPSCCLATLLNAADSVNSVAFSNDAATLASGHADSTILLCRLRLLREQQQLVASGGLPEDAPAAVRTLVGHSGPVYGLSFSRDDTFLLSASQDGSARLWSTNDTAQLQAGSCLVCYRAHGFPVWDVSFSPLAYFFATASHDGTARVWATDKLSPLRIMVGHLSDVHSVRFHPNSNYILTGSSDCSLRLWDVSSGSCVRLLCGHSAAVTTLAFSPDGRLCASGSADRTVRVWDLGSGRELHTFRGHTGAVWSVAFSQDEAGGVLASGGADCSVRLWDVNTASAPTAPMADIAGGGHEPRAAGCVAEFFTRNTPVLCTTFTRRNLLLAAGPYGGR